MPLRIVLNAGRNLEEDIARSIEIQRELWAIYEEVARTTDQGDLVSLYLDSLNDVIDLHELRVTAWFARSRRRCCSSWWAGRP